MRCYSQNLRQFIRKSVCAISCSILFAGGPTNSFATNPSSTIFDGCGGAGAEISGVRASAAPQRRVDPISNREFMSFSLEELESGSRDADTFDCWRRFDGVWQEETTISLDRRYQAEGWASSSPSLIGLAHGVYTTPEYIVVDPSPRPDEKLVLRFVSFNSEPIEFISNDDTELDEVLKRGGAQKTYHASNRDIPRAFRRLSIDVSRTGYIRLKIGERIYKRPRPGTARSEWSAQISDRDPFMIGFTMENLIANRRGIDVVTQDPHRFLDNAKDEVFKLSSRGYAIDERRIVPLGLRLVKEDSQGMVYYTSTIASERGYQTMIASSYGKSQKLGGSGEVGVQVGPFSFSRSVEYSASWGSESAREQIESMTRNEFVAQETGMMRYKKYALVLDAPYIRLSDRFIDAIDDAARTGDYHRIVERFGTHYPYAMTYGASGRLTQNLTAEGYAEAKSSSSETTSKFETVVDIYQQSTYRTSKSQSGTTVSERNEYGEKVFDAAGGNGSWNETGFAAGETSYPILADLRPLDELLNPIYFPGEPAIYEKARRGLAEAIEDYLWAHRDLSEESFLDDIEAAELFDGGEILNPYGFCLDVMGDGGRNGAKAIIWSCNGERSQQWRFDKGAVINGAGMCLDVHGPDIRRRGGKVQIWECHYGANQQWRHDGDRIISNAGMCLDVHGPDERRNGGPVRVWPCNGTDNQSWRR